MIEFHADSRASRSRRRNVAPVVIKGLGAAAVLLVALLAIYGATFT